MKQAPLTLKRWGGVEYKRLANLAIFEGEPDFSFEEVEG